MHNDGIFGVSDKSDVSPVLSTSPSFVSISLCGVQHYVYLLRLERESHLFSPDINEYYHDEIYM